MRIVRLAAAWLIGVLVAGGIIAVAEVLGHARARGDTVFAVAVAGYFTGALGGSAVASWLAGPKLSIAVPLTLAILALVNVLSFPHPGWFVPLATLALAAGWFAGVRVSRRLPTRSSPGTDS